jgi:hypothetical protein
LTPLVSQSRTQRGFDNFKRRNRFIKEPPNEEGTLPARERVPGAGKALIGEHRFVAKRG